MLRTTIGECCVTTRSLLYATEVRSLALRDQIGFMEEKFIHAVYIEEKFLSARWQAPEGYIVKLYTLRMQIKLNNALKIPTIFQNITIYLNLRYM